MRRPAIFHGISAVAMAAAVLLGGACSAPATQEARTVGDVRAVDGDTVVVENDERVRVLGVDAPELGRDGRPGDCGAAQAQTRLAELIGEGSVEVEGTTRDRYGRTLAVVHAEGVDVALLMLQEGWVSAWVPAGGVYPPDWLAYVEAEHQARSQRRGGWADCATVGRSSGAGVSAGG